MDEDAVIVGRGVRAYLLIRCTIYINIAGELYVVSIRGSSSVPFAGSLIQIVDPSRCGSTA